MFIGLTFVACLLFEMATGTRPHVAQYGLIGLALCVFYLLLLSVAEQVGFALAYSRAPRPSSRRPRCTTGRCAAAPAPPSPSAPSSPASMPDCTACCSSRTSHCSTGSLLLFAVLSVAMWLTRNIHRPQPA